MDGWRLLRREGEVGVCVCVYFSRSHNLMKSREGPLISHCYTQLLLRKQQQRDFVSFSLPPGHEKSGCGGRIWGLGS